MADVNDLLIVKFLRQINDDDQLVRINAINQLGEIGDELCLKELREKLSFISKEHYALVVAIGKLKRSLGVK